MRRNSSGCEGRLDLSHTKKADDMRNIYMPTPGDRFRPNIEKIASILPDVESIDIVFIQPSADNPILMSDIANSAEFIFKNGAVLSIEGHFLWKFRDSIPPSLGSELTGWNESNPYCGGSTKLLMSKLLKAYDAMFLNEEPDINARPPMSASISLIDGTVQSVFPSEMSKDTRESFIRIAGDDIHGQIARAKLDVHSLIKGALAKKR